MSRDTDSLLDSEAGRLPGILMLVGIVVFLVTVFTPTVLHDYFDTDVLEEQIAVIEGARTEWRIVWLVLAVGSTLLGLGLWQFSKALRDKVSDERDRMIVQGAGILGLVAQAGYALVGVYNAFASPKSSAEGPAGGDAPFLFWIYVLTLLLALAGFAFIVTRIKLRRWMAILLAVIVVLHLLQLVLTGDIVPLSIYLLLVPIAIALIARPLGQRPVAVAAAPA